MLLVVICGGPRSAWATLGSVSVEKSNCQLALDEGGSVTGGIRASRRGGVC